ncbi:MAG: PD40 domain-containing protein [Lewinellaceae bacterium]|nr:PD40 domain-containing protein [Saprospiraceae bacterium]MCB9338370.1 PD40 domain-containing protein [Lewinellaceae bacterium]
MSIIKKIFLFICLFGTAANTDGQTYKQYIKAADKDFVEENYYSAMKHYETAMTIEGEQPEVLYKYAEAARLLPSYVFADSAYTKVLASDSLSKYPLARYWLATVKKKQGKYAEAQALFQQFANERPKGVQDDYFQHAEQEVKELDWAVEAIEQPDENVTIKQLDTARINSTKSEFAPTQIGDKLYFSTMKLNKVLKKGLPEREFTQVMVTKVDSRKVDPAPFNDENRQTAHTAVNKSGTRLYYTLCDYVEETAVIRCEIYTRSIDPQGNFGPAVKLPASINKEGFTATEPSVGTDATSGEEWLYFVSDRPGGKGKMDIWASKIMKDSSYERPLNLTDINTPEDDITPFFHNASQTLYFSSEGRQGFGSYDIYKCELHDGQWLEVEHLPAPFNSSYGDSHFWMNPEQTKGYFASSRLGSHVFVPEYEACCNDIYEFQVQVIDLEVLTFNKKNLEPLPGVTLELFEMTKTGDVNIATTTNPDGNDFTQALRKGSKYHMLATRPGFLPIRDTVDLTLPANTQNRNLQRKLYLVPEPVDLHVTSFNKKNLNPLKGVEVRLVVDGQEIDFKKNEKGNDVDFVLERGKEYQLIGSKVAYFSDTAYIDLRTDITTTDVEQKLFLKPKEIEDFPPLVIYFDNDYPNPKTRKTTTEFSYKETWEAYMAKKDLFRQEYVTALEGFDSITAARRMDAFFEREVNNGYLSLEVFSENILEIMEDGGFKVELVIQGFTSPRASADYNYDLSQRRSDCLKNHFETWNGGVLMPYIKRGMLTMEVVGFGEKLAPQFISDRLDDERGSIYSVVASFERKVAIIGARRVAGN